MLGRLTEWLATSAQCEEAPEKVRFPLSLSAWLFFHSFLLDRVLSFLFWEKFFFKARCSLGRPSVVGIHPQKMHHPVPLSFFFFTIRVALSKVSFAPLRVRSFVRSFGCVGLLSLQGKKREREKERMVGKKRVCVCIFSHLRELLALTHVEEPTRERKKIIKNEHREFVRVIKRICTHTQTTGIHD